MKVTYWHRPQPEKREIEVDLPYYFGYSDSDDRWGYELIGEFDGQRTMTLKDGYSDRDKEYEIEISPGAPSEECFAQNRRRTAEQFDAMRAKFFHVLSSERKQ